MDFTNFFEVYNAFCTTAELFYDNCWEELSKHIEGCYYDGTIYETDTLKYPAFAKLAYNILFKNRNNDLFKLYLLFSSKLVESKLKFDEEDCEWSLRNMYTYNGYFTFTSPLVALREADAELNLLNRGRDF